MWPVGGEGVGLDVAKCGLLQEISSKDVVRWARLAKGYKHQRRTTLVRTPLVDG